MGIKNIVIAGIITVATLFSLFKGGVIVRASEVELVHVVDGDTVKIMKGGKRINVRLYGIDAPEKRQKYGGESTRTLTKMLLGKSLRLEEISKDRYGRTVGIIYADNQDVNLEMLKTGNAFFYKEYCKKKPLCYSYEQAENQARQKKKGVWSIRGIQKPSDWRKSKL